ncbi:inositol monophosphatase [Kitasatospora sp. CMC57]|uniref:Inositol monophosphatase n=1 Tax=Kitasatospora sp. CMC57 TaxID=3231513 RepID=A0AB33K057_9ACTN
MYEKTLSAVVGAVHATGEFLTERQPTAPWQGRTVAEALAAFERVDGPASALLRERLTDARPGAGWLTEEFATSVPGSGEWWSCDATDGAVQFLNGLPNWAVTATLVQDGEPVLAVVHSPWQRVTYTAVRGAGAWLDGHRIAPPARELAATVVGTSQPPQTAAIHLRQAGASLTAVVAKVLAVRNLGPTALQLAQVGSGHLNAFWEYGPDAGNLLSGALIAREAGALVTDGRGRPWTATADSLLAAPAGIHAELLDVLRQAEQPGGVVVADRP